MFEGLEDDRGCPEVLVDVVAGGGEGTRQVRLAVRPVVIRHRHIRGRSFLKVANQMGAPVRCLIYEQLSFGSAREVIDGSCEHLLVKVLLNYYVVLLFGLCLDSMNLIKVLAMNKLALVAISATSRS